jgi:cell shape-determining protein MreC
MNSFRRNNYRESNDTPLVVAFVAIFLVAVFVFGIDRISGGAVRGYARQGGGAMWAAASSATGVVTDSGLLNSKRSLVEENTVLREAIEARDEQALRFDALQDENDALRAMLGLATEAGVTVPVLSSFSSSPYGTFRIGGGAALGIEEGSIVLTPGGFVLGSVIFVSPHSATVESFFAADKEIEMQVNGFTFASEGRGGGNARGEIARDATVAENDVVIVPAFGGRPVGLVEHLESASSSAYTTLFIRTPTNLDSLRYVHVLPLQ